LLDDTEMCHGEVLDRTLFDHFGQLPGEGGKRVIAGEVTRLEGPASTALVVEA
jgi:hypothetical protein